MTEALGWKRIAERALRQALHEADPGSEQTVERLEELGRGACRAVFRARIDPGLVLGRERLRDLVVLVPRDEAPTSAPDDGGRARREALLLPRLARAGLPFRVPRWASAVPLEDGVVLVQEHLAGRRISFEPDAAARIGPEALGEVLGRLHALAPEELDLPCAGFVTQHEHGLAALAESESAAPADRGYTAGLEWLREHLLPELPARPSVPLHGDLVARNLLVDEHGSIAVLDWEFAHLGDPAFDLAIVTQGVARPFGAADGLERLLAAHAAAGGPAIEPESVRFHAIALHLRWLRRALGGPPDGRRMADVARRLEELAGAASG